MTPRSIRRAAERKAEKEVRKAARLSGPLDDFEQVPSAPSMSEARLAANRANAKLSTGPKTEEGKAKSRVNSVTTALTGRTVLLPSDDVDAYQRHVQIYVDEYQPVGRSESELVQALADHSWRLHRIFSLEHALYAFGFEQFSEQFADRGEMQASFTHLHTFLHYEKQFRNLQTQEMRLRRNRDKDTAELRRLQSERLSARTASVSESSVSGGTASVSESDSSRIGFVFSSGDVEPDFNVVRQFVTSPLTDSRMPEPSFELDSEPQIAA
ncbi:MAG: hypothetical protein WA324_07560 [Bryobacteraceae bacterium]